MPWPTVNWEVDDAVSECVEWGERGRIRRSPRIAAPAFRRVTGDENLAFHTRADWS